MSQGEAMRNWWSFHGEGWRCES